MALDLDARALTHSSTSTSRLGLLAKRSRLLRLQGDERLIALMREGHERAFEALVDRYQARLLAFCRGMLASSEDAEDVLQEVFVAAHKAILADNRAINARPWLYRIARNRCLNHLRKPVPEGQDSMDMLPHENGTSTAEKVEKRAEFRALLGDVQELPETQRTALLLREIDALSYEDIAVAMETTVPAVKSLLVRARISLADCSQGRQLTCDEVHLELAEAVEGLRKASGPARAHMKGCERCRRYRKELRRNGKALASMAPIGLLAGLQHGVLAKLGFGGANAAGGATAGGSAVGASAGSGGALGLAGSSAAGLGGVAVGAKAVAGVAASVALLTAGAVEVNRIATGSSGSKTAPVEQSGATAMVVDEDVHGMHGTSKPVHAAPVAAKEQGSEDEDEKTPGDDQADEDPAAETEAPAEPTAPVEETSETAPVEEAGTGDTAGGSGTGNADTTNPGDSDGVITPPTEPPAEPGTPPEEVPPAGTDTDPPATFGPAR